jgi:hypothetical protein
MLNSKPGLGLLDQSVATSQACGELLHGLGMSPCFSRIGLLAMARCSQQGAAGQYIPVRFIDTLGQQGQTFRGQDFGLRCPPLLQRQFAALAQCGAEKQRASGARGAKAANSLLKQGFRL